MIAQVSEGDGLMVVTAVGVYTRWGAIMKDASGESPETPLQQKLDALAGREDPLLQC